MNPLKLITDAYERKARLYPALICLCPIIITAFALIPGKLTTLQSIAGVIAGCGGAFLLAQLARDAGKKGEKTLYDRWGGMPSVAIFRHRNDRLDRITKARYHKKLAGLVKGAKAPSALDEQKDPAGADVVYTAWSTHVRVNTRDTKKYPLLFQENVNYGFRRNLWGLRATGMITSVSCTIVAGIVAYQSFHRTGIISAEAVGAGVLAVVFFALWAFRTTAAWVRIPADAYADRLAEAVDTLSTKAATKA